MTAVPRIAICGAGLSGLTLAGILSRSLGKNVRLSVFERASKDRDQGYGLDLDQNGQEALVRAGIYHRFWDISRPYTDSMALFPLSGTKPLGVMFRPRLLMKLFPSAWGSQPETNRSGLRDALLEVLSTRDNTHVKFETGANDIRPVVHGDDNHGGAANAAELFDRDGTSLGEFDLVIDAMGLHSTLRQFRVNDVVGKHFSGDILMHGVVNDVEACGRSDLIHRFGRYGTIMGIGRGYQIFMQRFGTSCKDNRASLFYMITPPQQDNAMGTNGQDPLTGEDGIFKDIGIEKPNSRKSGIIADPVRLSKVKCWILQDMSDVFDDVWKGAVQSLDRVTIRGDYTHGQETTLRGASECKMPLVCIGDSSLHCGLGGGGTLAMQDANELAKLLTRSDAFDTTTGCFHLGPIREAEQVMFARKVDFQHNKKKRVQLHSRAKEVGRGALSWDDIGLSGAWLRLAQMMLPIIGNVTNAWYGWEAKRGWAGTGPGDAPIYSNVKRLLDEQKQ